MAINADRYKEVSGKILIRFNFMPEWSFAFQGVELLVPPARKTFHLCSASNSVAQPGVQMPRLAPVLSGCSIIIVATWLLLGNHEASPVHVPAKLPPPGGVDGEHNRVMLMPHVEGPKQLDNKVRMAPKKKKQGMRNVIVDRANILEAVSLEDLRAPEGRLWIPAAVSGPIDPKSPNPIFNVLVAYCQLDMVSYHESPWLFAMGTFHQRTSGCLDDKSKVKTFRLSALKVSAQLAGGQPFKITHTHYSYNFLRICLGSTPVNARYVGNVFTCITPICRPVFPTRTAVVW